MTVCSGAWRNNDDGVHCIACNFLKAGHTERRALRIGAVRNGTIRRNDHDHGRVGVLAM